MTKTLTSTSEATDSIPAPKDLTELISHLSQYAVVFDQTIDRALPLVSIDSVKNHPIRYKVAFKLLRQLLSTAQTISKLTKIQSQVKIQAVDENCQSLLALIRVLVESCNKFFYLAIDPQDDKEIQIRWIYYSYVACVKYKKLLRSVQSMDVDPERDKIYARIDTSIANHKAQLSSAGIASWPPFLALASDKAKGATRQQQVLDGDTKDDYLPSDYNSAISRRLNEREKSHYQMLGNVGTHSSGLILFFESTDDEFSLISQATCLYLYNASRHLALCGLEMIHKFPEMETLLDSKAKADWEIMARDLKKSDYLYV
jgi:hypothetical protein